MPLLSGPGWKASEARQHFKQSHGCSAAATPAPNVTFLPVVEVRRTGTRKNAVLPD
jgi:hypothetical protein